MQLVLVLVGQQRVKLHDPQHDVGKEQFISNGRAMSFILLIKDSAKPF
jgi:hypothetical protein